MSNVNYVAGLHRIRVTYPLSFMKDGNATKCSTALTGYGVALFGSGKGAATIVRDDLGDTDQYGMAFYLKTGCTSSIGEFVGFHVDLLSDGTGSLVGIYSRVHGGSTGAKTSVRGIDGTVVISTPSIPSGYFAGVSACVEIPANATLGAVPGGACLELVNYNAVPLANDEASAYIWCREYSGAVGRFGNLINLYDTSATPGAVTTIFSPRGLHGKVGATTDMWIPVSLGLATTTAFYGRGQSGSNETMPSTATGAIELYLTSALGSGWMNGINLDLTMTNNGNVSGGNFIVTSTGGTKTVAQALYAQFYEKTAISVSGYSCAAEFSLKRDACSAGNPSDCAVLVLRSENEDTALGNANSAYIQLNDTGPGLAGTAMKDLFYFPDIAIGTHHDLKNVLLSETGDLVATHAIRMRVGPAWLWLLCNSVGPTHA